MKFGADIIEIVTAILGIVALGAIPWAFTLQRTIGEIKSSLDHFLEESKAIRMEIRQFHEILSIHDRRISILEHDASSDSP